jgi:hypothetical protein
MLLMVLMLLMLRMLLRTELCYRMVVLPLFAVAKGFGGGGAIANILNISNTRFSNSVVFWDVT